MENKIKRNSILDIQRQKGKRPIVCVAAYTYPTAKIIDEFCDIILVGDSLGMSIYGMKDTLSVSLSMMINHAKAVIKASKKSLIIVDLPFGSYETSKEKAFKSASRIIKETGCDAIKIEASLAMIDTIEFLVQRGIPVMGHIGLLPQHVRKIGSYKYQGKTKIESSQIVTIAENLEKSGVFALLVEGVYESSVDKILEIIKIPLIGIGASRKCDGQILVIDDIIGLNQDFKPKFVKSYGDIAGNIALAIKNYNKEVSDRSFPHKNNII